MYMAGIYDRNAKLCTLVTELNRTIIVDKAPLEILNDSIKCIGFDLRGAMETARWLLGNKNMCPVMVNPVHRICVIPDKSSKHNDNSIDSFQISYNMKQFSIFVYFRTD
jgi:competence protein ComK